MKILNNDECHECLTARGFDYDPAVRSQWKEGFVALPGDGLGHVFHTPVDAARQVLLARRLAGWPGGRDVLLWFTSWALYKPEEAELFREFRGRFGEGRWLLEAPGHLLDMTDPEDVWSATQLLLFMTAFTWEGFVLQGDRRIIIWMADEVIETYTLAETKAAGTKAWVEELFLSEIQTNQA